MAPFIRYEDVSNTADGLKPIVRYVNVALVETAVYNVDTGELSLRFGSSNDQGHPRMATLSGEEAQSARKVIDSLKA